MSSENVVDTFLRSELATRLGIPHADIGKLDLPAVKGYHQRFFQTYPGNNPGEAGAAFAALARDTAKVLKGLLRGDFSRQALQTLGRDLGAAFAATGRDTRREMDTFGNKDFTTGWQQAMLKVEVLNAIKAHGPSPA